MAVARFWRENASRYNLIGTKCGVCERVYFPPRSVCPTCHRASIGKMEPFKLKGEGEVLTFSIVHEAPSQMEMQKPYVIAIVEMDEGVRITGQIIDAELDDVAIGMKVRTTLRKVSDEGDAGVIHYGYKFMPL
ncbi:MAG: Zn-ribbon domain-containing OB-fold protein [Euryarchaeota archaeon]|nr:Zn-ribbon domain-containing OB-fold protein [Euryarchaeota archaeon]